jgi:hypothetical protein
VSTDWGGKDFDHLPDDEQQTLRLFSFTVYQYKQLSDPQVLDIFSRLNTYSVSLSAQELRNGRWFGRFKQVSYKVATESLEFWRAHKIFNEQQIARMREAELVSELLIASMDGIQDKKASLDSFYERLDEDWGSAPQTWEIGKLSGRRPQPAAYLDEQSAVRRFMANISAIDESVGEVLITSPLRRPALFHTLYCAVDHIVHGLPRGGDLPLGKAGMTDRTRIALRQVSSQLSDVFENKGRSSNDLLRQFYEASARQTDNAGPRHDRLRTLLELVDAAR